MADQSDVESAMVTLAASALYPNGRGTKSVPGPDCQIYRGWPNSAALDNDLAAGRVNVTVFPMAEPGRNTSRYLQQRQCTTQQASLTVMVSEATVAFIGDAKPGQIAGVLVDGHSYIYRIQAGDTPAVVAANLATLARSGWIVTLAGSALTIPGARSLSARVVAEASVVQEVRRQEQGFRVTCWCPDPASRDSAAAAIDSLFAGIRFISLADGTQGRLQYRGCLVFDQSQDAMLYRRDLIYDVEYPSTTVETLPAMLFGTLIYNRDTLTA